jgi:hypothetical protein
MYKDIREEVIKGLFHRQNIYTLIKIYTITIL